MVQRNAENIWRSYQFHVQNCSYQSNYKKIAITRESSTNCELTRNTVVQRLFYSQNARRTFTSPKEAIETVSRLFWRYLIQNRKMFWKLISSSAKVRKSLYATILEKNKLFVFYFTFSTNFSCCISLLETDF